MTEHKRKDGKPLSKDDVAKVKAKLVKRRQEGITDDDICKEAGISLTTLSAIAYGR